MQLICQSVVCSCHAESRHCCFSKPSGIRVRVSVLRIFYSDVCVLPFYLELAYNWVIHFLGPFPALRTRERSALVKKPPVANALSWEQTAPYEGGSWHWFTQADGKQTIYETHEVMTYCQRMISVVKVLIKSSKVNALFLRPIFSVSRDPVHFFGNPQSSSRRLLTSRLVLTQNFSF